MKNIRINSIGKLPEKHTQNQESQQTFLYRLSTTIKYTQLEGIMICGQGVSKKINAGEAVLSIRVWEGKPYNSKQREIFRYDYRRKMELRS